MFVFLDIENNSNKSYKTLISMKNFNRIYERDFILLKAMNAKKEEFYKS